MNQLNGKPLWETMQAEIEKDVMAPPVGSIYGPEDYARGLQAIIDFLMQEWRAGHDTSGAVHVLKKEKMIATGDHDRLIG